MKAAHVQHYNKKNITVTLVDVDKPPVGDNDVCIRVLAAGVNPVDNMISRGEVRMIVPYKLPLVAGNEFVGIVEEIGPKVSRVALHDRVFARLPLDSIGAFAEYVVTDETALAKVPSYLSDVEAAAVPLTALTAMQAFDIMQVERGKTIFISGGTGSVGAMAIPIAKAKGLRVITNGSAAGRDRVLALGASQFIDYKTEDYTTMLSGVDYVLDTLGGNETERQMQILKKGGKLVSLRAMPNGAFARRMNLPKWKQVVLGIAGHALDTLANNYGVSYDFMFVESNGKQLQEAASILETCKVRPSIDAIYPLEEVNAALANVAKGGSSGKTIITIGGK